MSGTLKFRGFESIQYKTSSKLEEKGFSERQLLGFVRSRAYLALEDFMREGYCNDKKMDMSRLCLQY